MNTFNNKETDTRVFENNEEGVTEGESNMASEQSDEAFVEGALFAAFNRCAHVLHHRQNQGHERGRGHGHGNHSGHGHGPGHGGNFEQGRGQGRILAMLLKHEVMKQKALQEMADIRSSSLSELVAKLEDEGLVQRLRDEADKRNFNISLTEEGKNRAQLYQEKRKNFAMGLFDALSDEEKLTLTALLTKLSASWSEDSVTENSKRHKGHGCSGDDQGCTEGCHRAQGCRREESREGRGERYHAFDHQNTHERHHERHHARRHR